MNWNNLLLPCQGWKSSRCAHPNGKVYSLLWVMWILMMIVWFSLTLKSQNILLVGLMGLDPCSTLISQANPYTSGPFSINPRSMNWSLTRSSMWGCRNQVSTPWDGSDVALYPNPSFMQINKPFRAYRYTSFSCPLDLCEGLWLSFADPK